MDLETELKSPLPKVRIDLIADMAIKYQHDVGKLIALTFHQQEQVGFRAAWILENIFTAKPCSFAPFLAQFITAFPKQNNFSARRHFAKVMALATAKKAPIAIKSVLEGADLEKMAETSFAWLVDDNPVAIKSHCLNILANLAPRYPWIKDELMQTMDYLVDKESIAFFAKVKQVKKQLCKRDR